MEHVLEHCINGTDTDSLSLQLTHEKRSMNPGLQIPKLAIVGFEAAIEAEENSLDKKISEV